MRFVAFHYPKTSVDVLPRSRTPLGLAGCFCKLVGEPYGSFVRWGHVEPAKWNAIFCGLDFPQFTFKLPHLQWNFQLSIRGKLLESIYEVGMSLPSLHVP